MMLSTSPDNKHSLENLYKSRNKRKYIVNIASEKKIHTTKIQRKI